MGPSRIRLHCATTGALSRAHFYMPRKLKKSACLASLEESATQPAASPRGACAMNQVRTHRTPAPRPSFSQEMRVKQKKKNTQGQMLPARAKPKPEAMQQHPFGPASSVSCTTWRCSQDANAPSSSRLLWGMDMCACHVGLCPARLQR